MTTTTMLYTANQQFDTLKLKETIGKTHVLNLQGMQLCDDGFRKLIPLILETKDVLKRLHLSGNKLTDISMINLVDVIQQENSAVEYIGLQENNISYLGLKLICDYMAAVKNKVISIDMEMNSEIGVPGGYSIAHLLVNNSSLITLNISGCELKEEGLLAIASVFYHGRNSTLQTLIADDNDCMDQSVYQFLQICLKEHGNGDGKQYKTYSNLISQLPSISEIELYAQDISNQTKNANKRRSRGTRKSWSLTIGTKLNSPLSKFDFELLENNSQPSTPTSSSSSGATQFTGSQPTQTKHLSLERVGNNKSLQSTSPPSTARRGRVASLKLKSITSLFKSRMDCCEDSPSMVESELVNQLQKMESENSELKQRLETMQFMYDNLHKQFDQYKKLHEPK